MNRQLFKHALFVSLALLVIAAHSARGDEKKERLFPAMDGWELQIGDKVYNPGNLWNIINGAADAYLSYDFQKLYTAEYFNDQDQRLKVYVFQHSSPTNAFGIYSQERNPDYDFVSVGAQGFKDQYAYYFITGPYYVQISTNAEKMGSAMDKLARQIDHKLNTSDQLPGQLELLPQKGRMKNTEKYIAANYMGYSYLKSAYVADYKRKDQRFKVFVLAPDSQQSTGDMLSRYLDFLEHPKDKRHQDVIQVEDPYNGSIWLYPHDNYLAGVIGGNEELKKQYIELLKANLK